MSKAVTIQQDGVGQNLSLDVLRVPKMGGGTEDWVPEDGKNLVSIRVKENGTYNASDFGAYGIAEVRVACTANGGAATSTDTEKRIDEKSNPAIKEGGRARAFTTKRLATPLTAGGKCRWLQKALVALGTKYIGTDNTTYKAEDDGKYGYSQVTVSGISISKTTDPDGNEVVTHTDDTGTVTEIVPSSIALEPAPSFLGPYGDHAYISFDGMVVKAYKGDGSLWTDAKHPNGIIPFEELTLPVTVTDISQAVSGTGVKTLDGKSVEVSRSMTILQNWDSGAGGWVKNLSVVNSCAPGVLIINVGGHDYAVSDIYDASVHYAYSSDGEYRYSEELRGKTGFNATVNNICISEVTHEMMYFGYVEGAGRSDSGAWQRFDTPDVPASEYDFELSADIALHGEGEIQSGQIIPVQWVRPGDNEVLETTFIVEVVDVSPNNNVEN